MQRILTALPCLVLALVSTLPMATSFAQRPEMLPYVTIDHPNFVPAAEAEFMKDDYVVIGIASGRVIKAYPAADLAQHGSALDVMPEGPVTVTWCGVCNVGVVYRREVDGRILHFDYDSMEHANEVQKDRETGSRWQQALGEAIDGPLRGRRLAPYPFTRTSWGEWRRQYPQTLVMQPQPGYAERMPMMNRLSKGAYVGEGEAPAKAGFNGDFRVRPRELVAGLEMGNAQKAYPFSALRAVRVVNDRVGGRPLLVVHQPGSDTTTAFIARARGRDLTFDAATDDVSELIDRETRSRWTAYGNSIAGSLKGAQLERQILVSQFWFAWSQFHPGTELYVPGASAGAVWEPLLRTPFPVDAIPKLIALKLRVRPAPIERTNAGAAGHHHDAPVLAYVLHGKIENKVEPDPVRVLEGGGFFLEAPGQEHTLLRNLSTTGIAEVLVFMGDEARRNIPPLIEVPMETTINQEVSLLRATIGAGAMLASRPHDGPALVYVLEGEIDGAAIADGRQSHGAGDLFIEAAHTGTVRYRNRSSSVAARILVFAASTRNQ